MIPQSRSAVMEGARDALPVAGVYAASGLALGVLARQASLGSADVGLMSLLVYAGSTQFTAVGLLIGAAPSFAILTTTLLLSLRSLTYGAALAPYLSATRTWQRLALGFGLTDEAFALAVRRFRAHSADLPYMAGVIGTAFPAWVISTALAAGLGGTVPHPRTVGLDVAFPAIFLGLVLPALRTATEWQVAGLAALLTLGGRAMLPEGIVLFIAGLLGPVAVLISGAGRPGRRD